MWVVRAILIALVVVCIIGFAIKNVYLDQKVDVDLVWTVREGVQLLVVIFWSFAAGVFVSLLLLVLAYIRLSVQLRATRKQMRALESEVAILRNRPIEESAGLLGPEDNRTSSSSSLFESGEQA